jgi:hypothetical protein
MPNLSRNHAGAGTTRRTTAAGRGAREQLARERHRRGRAAARAPWWRIGHERWRPTRAAALSIAVHTRPSTQRMIPPIRMVRTTC